MSVLDGAQGGGGAGDEDIDPATGLPRVPVQGGPGLLDRAEALVPQILQSPVTGGIFPIIGGLNTATNILDKANILGTPPPAASPETVEPAPALPEAAPPPLAPPVVAPPPKPPAGGGGGPRLPLGPSAGETVARGAVQTADEGANEVLRRKGELEAQKANDQVALDIAQKERERQLQQQTDERAAQLNADLKAKQDVLAKDKIHDMFEGRPLAAVVAALSSGLGAFAATRTGGVNHAQAILDNAAQMFRQKEMHRIEQEEKGVEGARTDINHAEARADASMAQLYRTFAQDRERVLRARGADDATIQNDALIQQNVQKGAERDLLWQQRNSDIARQEVNDRAQRAAQYASANHSNAEAAKVRAEIGAAGGPKASGRAAAYQMGQAAMGSMLGHDEQVIDQAAAGGVTLTPEDLQNIQDKETRIKGSEHDTSTLGTAVTTGLRKVGLSPRSSTEDLDPKKQVLYNALATGAKKSAATVTGSKAQGEIESLMPRFMPQAGDSPALIKEKIESQRMMGHVARALAGAYGPVAQQAVEEARAKGAGVDEMIRIGAGVAKMGGVPVAPSAPAAARPKMTQAERVRATDFVRANPRDPKAASIRQLLQEQ